MWGSPPPTRLGVALELAMQQARRRLDERTKRIGDRGSSAKAVGRTATSWSGPFVVSVWAARSCNRSSSALTRRPPALKTQSQDSLAAHT
jgi:hypothetical protein